MVIYFPGAAFVLLLLVMLILSAVATLVAASQALPGCQDLCGKVSIPYPFGIGDRCSLNPDFNITCNHSTPYLGTSNIEINYISIHGELNVLIFVASQCHNHPSGWADLILEKFSISKSKNKFVVIGCDSYGYLNGERADGQDSKLYKAGCISTCYQPDYVDNKTCSGSGCCQMDIPDGLYNINLTAHRFYEHNETLDFNPCTYSLVVEQRKFKFSSQYLQKLPLDKFPVVLNWEIDDNIYNSVCLENSTRYTRDGVTRYLCRCKHGYRGNPYLHQGCQDIDECRDPSSNDCQYPNYCRNTMGNYTCSCPKGHHGDGRKNGQGCAPNRSLWITIVVGVSAGISVLVLISSFVYFGIQKRKTNKLREKNFKENGGFVLLRILSQIEGSVQKAKIFTEEELKNATKNFNKSEIVGRGGFGTVFKGNLDGTAVAIKRSKVLDVDHNQIEQFINELIILSQIDHPNVVKLIGCCLETPVPLLVYEFITNKDLNYHIHKGFASSIAWETRLKIAVETARAIAHMHSEVPIHIIHRDVKSANILLDDKFTAKVSDFGVSRLVPLDQTQLSTVVQGTWGYIDPEYFESGMLTEKSDVYSFGVVLAELLTGQDVLSTKRPVKDKSLATLLISAMKEDRLFEIIDKRVMEEADPEQVKRVAELANQCLRSRGKKRPTMIDVKLTLEEIRANKCNQAGVVVDYQETQPLFIPTIHPSDTGSSIRPDSLNNISFSSFASGR